MNKKYAWPKGRWDWPIKVSHKHGVRCGQMIWVGGQVDLTSTGEVRNSGNLSAQVANCVENLRKVLEDLGSGLPDLVKLLCFYVNDGSVDESNFLSMVARTLPPGANPAVTVVPVPYLAYPGMVVEIEGYAMRGTDDRPLPRRTLDRSGLSPLPAPFMQGVRCGKMIFVSGQSPVDDRGNVVLVNDIVGQTRQVMKQVQRILGSFGADFDDVVKLNRWYVGHGTVEDFEPAAFACAAHFKEPGPTATGMPLPRHSLPGQQIKIEVVAMLG